MAWTKPTTRTAKADANNISLALRRDATNNDWLIVVHVDTEEPGGAEQAGILLGDAVTKSVITDDQRTRLLNICRALRNEGLMRLGYTEG